MSGFLLQTVWYNLGNMAVFYQKYRPQKFADVIGQEAIVQTLKNAAKAGALSHAYLFTGSRGVGKTTLARLLAKAANCQSLKDGDPCGTCDICTSVANGTSLDIIEIDAASHTGVDNVREFIEHAGFRPTSMSRKVFIIDEVHMLSKAAFNALLKTLEEPPEHVMFVLATTDIEKVPATIVSRTQRFDFKRINAVQMSAALETIAKDQKLKLPEGVVDAVVSQSEGSMRDALTRLDMVASLGTKITLEEAELLLGVTPKASIQELVNLVISGQSASLPEYFEKALSKGADPSAFNRGILVYLRQVLGAKLTQTTPPEFKNDGVFASQVSRMEISQIMFALRLFLRSYKELSSAPSPELPLLLASIEASFQGSSTSVSTAIAPAPVTVSTQPTIVSADESGNSAEEFVDEAKQSPTIAQERTVDSLMPPEEIINRDVEITMEEVSQWWPEVISKIKVENSPVATLLKNSPVVEVESDRITIGVKYLFHKENLDNKKNVVLITDAIQSVCGKAVRFRSIIKNHGVKPITDTVDAFSDALKVFGGELIE